MVKIYSSIYTQLYFILIWNLSITLDRAHRDLSGTPGYILSTCDWMNRSEKTRICRQLPWHVYYDKSWLERKVRRMLPATSSLRRQQKGIWFAKNTLLWSVFRKKACKKSNLASKVKVISTRLDRIGQLTLSVTTLFFGTYVSFV